MKALLWFLSFVFLCIAAITGLGVSIEALKPEWFAVTLVSIAMMFSCAEFADKYFGE